MTALVFLDTETLGPNLSDPIWEIAAIRREADGTETRHHWHVVGPRGAALTPPEGFPERFLSDFRSRYGYEDMIGRASLRPALRHLFRDRPHVIGAVPNFDTERIAYQFEVTGWHYHLIDVENLAVGWLAGQGEPLPPLPWDSDALSAAVGVDPARFRRHEAMADVEWAIDPAQFRRHEAMADVEWAMAIYDRITGQSS